MALRLEDKQALVAEVNEVAARPRIPQLLPSIAG